MSSRASRGVRAIYVFDVNGDDKLANGKKLIICTKEETPDGFRVDVDGNLWCGWGMGTAELDGVRIFNPQGKPIGHISLPERCANVCFGGPKRNRLFMAASHSVYALYVNTQGATWAAGFPLPGDARLRSDEGRPTASHQRWGATS